MSDSVEELIRDDYVRIKQKNAEVNRTEQWGGGRTEKTKAG